MTGPHTRWVRIAYWSLPALTLLAVMVGTRRPIAFIPYAALVVLAGLYLVVSGGGILRRQFAHPPPPGAFRVLGVIMIVGGTRVPSGFLVRTGLSKDPVLVALFYGSAVVGFGCLITLYVRYRNAFNAPEG